MTLAEHPLLGSFAGKPAVLDSNLLLLDWCLKFDQSLIHSYKRLNNFELDDAFLLSLTLKLFSSVSTTPQVLTEVSNLANSLPGWRREPWSSFFAGQIQLIPEIYTASSEIASDPAGMRFGITDAALTQLATRFVILTVDWPLANLLEPRELLVINFNHLRTAFRFA